MDLIVSTFRRLHENVNQFSVPSAVFWDVPALKAQIEFRQRALIDIWIISRRLRPFMRSENQRQHRKNCERRGRQSRIGNRPRRHGLTDKLTHA
jgi:hypothetical protein